MMSFSKPNQGKKRKHMSLSLNDKLCVIEKLEKGASVSSICAQYGIAKQTVSDIRKKTADIRKFVLKFNVDKEVSAVKRMRMPLDQSLDDAVYKWFCQLRSSGMVVRGIEIQATAERLAKQLDINNFKASSGWLFRFKRRHNITNNKICKECLNNKDYEAFKQFREKLNDILKAENIHPSQLYNYDEAGLYWRVLPDGTQVSKAEKNMHGRKISKDRVSVSLCSNADGSHMLKPVIVGKSKKQCAINNINTLPVHYYNSKNAWFTSDITIDWFHNKAVPEIRRYQTEVLKIPDNEVKALVLLDNCPAHPQVEQLTTNDKKIRCMFLPANTTSAIQPMEQGIIYTAKRLYKNKLLNEILKVDEPGAREDRKVSKTSLNLKDYNIRSMILNFSSAVKEIKPSTLINSWKKLLINEEIEPDTAGLETEDFYNTYCQEFSPPTTLEDIELWLEADEDDLGYHILTEEEIVESLIAAEYSEMDEYDQEEADNIINPKPKLSEIKDHLNIVIKYVEDNNNKNISAYYKHLKNLSELINK